jgi:hypothetical protein
MHTYCTLTVITTVRLPVTQLTLQCFSADAQLPISINNNNGRKSDTIIIFIFVFIFIFIFILFDADDDDPDPVPDVQLQFAADDAVTISYICTKARRRGDVDNNGEALALLFIFI